MKVFLDFEASSLGKRSFPIEVGWVFEDGISESHLIKPHIDWQDWDKRSEAVHGIKRCTLQSEGAPVVVVAKRMIDALSGHALYASSPSWDGKWLNTLLRAAGLPRHALRLEATGVAQAEAAATCLWGALEREGLIREVELLLSVVEREKAEQQSVHRALADAMREREMWFRMITLATERATTILASRGCCQ